MDQGDARLGNRPYSALPVGVDGSQYYLVYGLRTLSEVTLPGWPTIVSRSDPDLVIQKSQLTRPVVEGPDHMAQWVVDRGSFELAVHGVARYRVVDPSLLEVDPEPEADQTDVLLYLTGAALSAVLHQRGLFPLHASSVAIDGHAVAIAGPSGAGKSTLVAALVARGAEFLTDDVCVLAELPGGEFGVWPGAARAKLDRLALSTLEGEVRGLDPAGGTRGKFQVPFRRSTEALTPVPLSRVYFLTDDDGPIRFEVLSGLEAVSTLVQETYFIQYAAALGAGEGCFRLAAALARRVQVGCLMRPRAIDRVAELAALIEADVRPG